MSKKETIKKAELIEEIRQKTKMSRDEILKVYDTIFEVFKDKLKQGNDVLVVGFGSFRVGHRNARKGIKPKTGETIQISPRNVVTFKPSVPLKEMINK